MQLKKSDLRVQMREEYMHIQMLTFTLNIEKHLPVTLSNIMCYSDLVITDNESYNSDCDPFLLILKIFKILI
jgi:hypothetical protein